MGTSVHPGSLETVDYRKKPAINPGFPAVYREKAEHLAIFRWGWYLQGER
jgi:hypothetical protein